MLTCAKQRKSSLEDIPPQVAIRNYLEKYGFNGQLLKEDLDSKTKVSVVIPVYNEAGVITRCLQALNEQFYNAFEVVVVDNGSTDETLKEIENFSRQASYPLYVIEEHTPGVAAARKRGMDEVLSRLLKRGREFHHVLVVTDADVIPPKEWLEKIIVGLGCHRHGGLAGTHKASEEVEEKIHKATGIRNYFNIIPSLIEFIEKRGVGEIKMSGPNSAFTAVSYALGGGIKQEFSSDGKPKLSEVNNLGNRIRQCGYEIIPMWCQVVKNRRRELFEIINNCEDSYFPKSFSSSGRFNVIRENEVELLSFACNNVSKETWEYYRYKMIYKVLWNFVLQPFALGKKTEEQVREILTVKEIDTLLSSYSPLTNFPNNQYTHEFFRDLLSRLERVLQL